MDADSWASRCRSGQLDVAGRAISLQNNQRGSATPTDTCLPQAVAPPGSRADLWHGLARSVTLGDVRRVGMPMGANTSPLLAALVSLCASLNGGCSRDFSFLDEKVSTDPRPLDGSVHEPEASSTAHLRDAAPEGTSSTDALALIDAGEASRADALEAGGDAPQPHGIALRGNHLCVIDPRDGAVLCRGENQGTDPDVEAGIREWHPVLVNTAGPKLTKAKTLAAGQDFTCAIVESGDVYCWGTIPGTLEYSPSARRVITGLQHQFDRIEAGEGHVCISDPVYCWGDNSFAQIMDPGPGDAGGFPEPMRILALSGRNAVTLGFRHTCANDGDRTLCWGLDDFRQCGNKPDAVCAGGAPCATLPIEVSGISGAIGLGLGTSHSCAIEAKGTVVCWGASDAGQSGIVAPIGCINDGCAVDVTNIDKLHVHDVTHLALGSAHSCASTASGLVFCWGSNSAGQMGIDSIGGIGSEPLQVLADLGNPLEGVEDIVASGNFTCVLSKSGHLSCWGRFMNDPILASATEIPYQ